MIDLLIVDDSPLLMLSATQVLTYHELGITLHTASSASEALQVLKSQNIDIMLLDIVMPVMSGVELLQILTQDQILDTLKVIMFSSLSDRSVLKQCFDLGATDFISKPLDEVEFISRIQAAINEQTIKKQYRDSIKLLSKQNDELTQVYKQLLQTQHRMIQQEQMAGVGYLAAGIAHEINNPISFIKNNIKVMSKYLNQLTHELRENPHENCQTDYEWIETDSKSLVDETYEGLERVTTIVSSLRNFSGIDQFEAEGDFSLSESCYDLLKLVKSDMDSQIELLVDLNCDATIRANNAPLNTALLNIVKNAIYALKTHQANRVKRLTVTTWCEPDYSCCKIRDNGMGISDENIAMVCTPFFTTKPIGSGMGLGMTVAYDVIVNQNHGLLEILSKEGEWTEVVVKLPLT